MERLIKWLAFDLILLSASASTSVLAVDNDARIKALEEQNKQLTKQVEKLEQKVSKESGKARKGLASVKTVVRKIEDRLKVDGFLTVGATKSTHNNEDNTYGFNDKIDFRADSILALQFNFQLTQQLDVVAQMVAKGANDFEINAEWAYLAYKPTDNLTLRSGRLRMPPYLYSEPIDVGFVYPWVRPPVEIYAADQATIEGIDGFYRFFVSEWFYTVHLFGGDKNYPDVKPIEATVKGFDVIAPPEAIGWRGMIFGERILLSIRGH